MSTTYEVILSPGVNTPAQTIRFTREFPLINPNQDDIVRAAVGAEVLDPDMRKWVEGASEVVRFDFPGDEYVDFKRLEGNGAFETNMFEQDEQGNTLRPNAYNAALDALFSYVLALYAAGENIEMEAHREALNQIVGQMADNSFIG